jgi:hypothetical protein
MLACLAQISWMRRAQSESLIMWVRDSIEDPDPGQPQPRHALLPATEVLPHSPDACADALRVPRVALMFLTTGDLYHEETWRLWFKSAAGVLPAQVRRWREGWEGGERGDAMRGMPCCCCCRRGYCR